MPKQKRKSPAYKKMYKATVLDLVQAEGINASLQIRIRELEHNLNEGKEKLKQEQVRFTNLKIQFGKLVAQMNETEADLISALRFW